MVEGHQCHRVAAAHRKLLVGHAFKATSPNGRFSEGAEAINNRPLSKIEVHGKNLFYFFSKASTPSSKKLQTPPSVHDIVHVHFGMSGAFKTMSPPGAEPTPTTRLRLESPKLNVIAHLSAMTVVHGDDEYYKTKSESLGPDPLREDADGEQLWMSVQKSKKPIGLVLMDQTLVAGLGNIYRAEVLFKARVHPEQPASSITRCEFDEIWKHSVLLLQRGFQTGSIVTVDAADAQTMGPPWTRRYVYNHSHCGMCKGLIKTWDMATRTVYACETCQILRGKVDLPKARKDAMAGASNAKEFVSHCAAEGGDTVTPEKMTIAQLRLTLLRLGVQPPSPARKAALVVALQAARDGKVATEAPEDGETGAAHKNESTEEPKVAAQQQVATPPLLASPSDATGGSKASTHSNVVLAQLRGSKATGTDSSVQVDAVAGGHQTVKEIPAVHRTPKRPSSIAAPCEVTPDSKHAKQQHRLRTVSGPSEGMHEGGGSIVAHEDTQARKDADDADACMDAMHDRHEAVDALTVEMVKSMKVPELKATLQKHKLQFASRAAKSELTELLISMVCNGNSKRGETKPLDADGKDSEDVSDGTGDLVVVPGTQGLRMVATAAAAANEKVKAGENRAVEHVALVDTDVAGNLL